MLVFHIFIILEHHDINHSRSLYSNFSCCNVTESLSLACVWSLPSVLLICVIQFFCISIQHFISVNLHTFSFIPIFSLIPSDSRKHIIQNIHVASFIWAISLWASDHYSATCVNTFLSTALYEVIYLAFYLYSHSQFVAIVHCVMQKQCVLHDCHSDKHSAFL